MTRFGTGHSSSCGIIRHATVPSSAMSTKRLKRRAYLHVGTFAKLGSSMSNTPFWWSARLRTGSVPWSPKQSDASRRRLRTKCARRRPPMLRSSPPFGRRSKQPPPGMAPCRCRLRASTTTGRPWAPGYSSYLPKQRVPWRHDAKRPKSTMAKLLSTGVDKVSSGSKPQRR